MAIVAAGRFQGVASNANLHLSKTKGQWNTGSGQPEDDRNVGIRPAALNRIFINLRSHIGRRIADDFNAKSVINMSWGKLSK